MWYAFAGSRKCLLYDGGNDDDDDDDDELSKVSDREASRRKRFARSAEWEEYNKA